MPTLAESSGSTNATKIWYHVLDNKRYLTKLEKFSGSDVSDLRRAIWRQEGKRKFVDSWAFLKLSFTDANTKQITELNEGELGKNTDFPTFISKHIIGKNNPILVELPGGTKRKRERVTILGAVNIGGNLFQTGDGSSKTVALADGTTNFYDIRTFDGMIFADKTNFIKELEKQPNYKYTFLRPRRFGKSTFLNMLCTYYDIHAKDDFNNLFGPLYIGQNPTNSANSHLVLKFDLSPIQVFPDLTNMVPTFIALIDRTLEAFLDKYDEELKPGNKKIIDVEPATSLWNVLVNSGSSVFAHNAKKNNIYLSQLMKNLVSERGYTLFVGVDEYDAPANEVMFSSNFDREHIHLQYIQEIESYLKSNFFSVLKMGCGDGMDSAVIQKLFITGVTPVFRGGLSPLLFARIANFTELNSACGFTEGDVRIMIKKILTIHDDNEVERILVFMKYLYNGYFFADIPYDERNPNLGLYNPEFVFHYLKNFNQTLGSTFKPKGALMHSSRLLDFFNNKQICSIDKLTSLIFEGHIDVEIQTEFTYSDLFTNNEKSLATAFSLLMYLGVLTYSPTGKLRIPNEVMKTEVLVRITRHLKNDQKRSKRIEEAYALLIKGEPWEMGRLLGEFLNQRTLMSFRSMREDGLQAVMEAFLDPITTNSMSQLLIVKDGTKESGKGHFGFIDIFLPRPEDGIMSIIIELKYISLLGFWLMEQGWDPLGKLAMPEPKSKDLDDLNNRLKNEDQFFQVNRKYVYYSKDKNKYVITTLGDLIQDAREQCTKYLNIVVKGEPRNLVDTGVIDKRLKIAKNRAKDRYKAFVFIVFGTTVLTIPVRTMEGTPYDAAMRH